VNRDKLKAAIAEAERFIARAKTLPKPTTYEVPGSQFNPFTHDNFPREQGAIRRASMDLTRALADLRRPNP
jgi:hypothetical protein